MYKRQELFFSLSKAYDLYNYLLMLMIALTEYAQKLDEIVVTAMGISREKKALGYAVQDVKSDVLTLSLIHISPPIFLYRHRSPS